MNIGLIGCGSIGCFLLENINKKERVTGARITEVLDERKDKGAVVAGIAEHYGARHVDDMESFLCSGIDFVIEAAEPMVAKKYAPAVVRHGISMLILSVGALADEAFTQAIADLCRVHNSRVYLPSGAIGGLDALAAANALGEIEEVRLTTRKPPGALGLEVEGGEPVTLFSGVAAEAISKFPKNINVAVTLSLAGLGPKQTLVEIIADPGVVRNTHEVTIKGKAGMVKVVLENLPMPSNPKTSYLAALSALSTLQRLNQPIKVGA